MEKKLIFLDGFLIPASEGFLKSLAPGILVGRGVFETMRVYRGEIFALEDHFQRLLKGLKVLRIQVPYSQDTLKEHLKKVLVSNRLKDARMRLTIWRSKERIRISIIVSPYRGYPDQRYRKGFKAVFSGIRRDETSQKVRIKSVNYLPLLMAKRQAKAKGYDEALLLNSQGDIAEGSYTSVFYVKHGELFTPSLASGCLEGITRRHVLDIARKKKIRSHQRRVTRRDLLSCDEAFLTNSLIEVMALTDLDGQPLGQGRRGPLTKMLALEYRKLRSALKGK